MASLTFNDHLRPAGSYLSLPWTDPTDCDGSNCRSEEANLAIPPAIASFTTAACACNFNIRYPSESSNLVLLGDESLFQRGITRSGSAVAV